MRILLLEDYSTGSQKTFRTLERLGFDVLVLTSLVDVEKRLEKQPDIDAILLDITRKDNSGFDWFDKVRVLNRDLPVVVYTVHDDLPLSFEFIRKGAQDYFVKGSSDDESIGRCLRYAVERNRVVINQRNNEMRMKLVLEDSYDAFFSMDSQLNIIEWNAFAEQTFGWRKNEIEGKSLDNIVPHHLRKQFLQNIRAYFAAQEGNFLKTSREIIAEHRSGQRFAAEFGVFRIESAGECVFYGFLRDITKEKSSKHELERMVHERTEELIRSNEELRQFAKIASHDLQEPLRTVEGFAKLLVKGTRGKLEGDQIEFIDFILDGIKRMQHLIHAILVHSQVDASASINQITNCNLVVQDVLEDLHSSIEQATASFEIDSLPAVAVERSQMHQLFRNLIHNALKYRSKNSPLISVTAKSADQQCLFSISDNGIGIEHKYAEKIFDMFSRLHSKEEYPGTGMGLAICKRIVTCHGGTIWVESAIGKGSSFMFTLPVGRKKEKKK